MFLNLCVDVLGRGRRVVLLQGINHERVKSLKRGLSLGLVFISVCLSLPAMAQHDSARGAGGGSGGRSASGGGAGHGGGAFRGGGNCGNRGFRGGGAGWWGLSLGLGLGIDPALAYPYYAYPPVYYYDGTPAVVVDPSVLPAAPPAMMVVPPPSSASASTWYYCDSARAFYPYVTQCPEPWRMVPSTPSAMSRS
jgi:hypothetical protein